MSKAAHTHKYGGGWTEIKLEVLKSYLHFYTKALQNQPFELIYIDAFAGNGRCELESSGAGFKLVDGSALIALNTEPRFDALYFIERDQGRANDLRLAVEHDSRAHVYCGSCETLLEGLLPEALQGGRRRGVIFLDPYGLQVDFEMLKRIAATEALDVWYLFPLSGTLRQMSRALDKVDAAKEQALCKLLGGSDWQTSLYRPSPQHSLFSDDPVMERDTGDHALVEFVLDRLSTVFPFVYRDVMRLPSRPPYFFALIFACANPSPKAYGLAQRPLRHIMKS